MKRLARQDRSAGRHPSRVPHRSVSWIGSVSCFDRRLHYESVWVLFAVNGKSLVANLEGLSIAVDARIVKRPGIGFYTYLQGAMQCLLDMGARVSLLTNFPPENYESLFPTAEWLEFGSHRNLIWDQYDLPKFLRRKAFDLYWAPCNNGIPFLPAGRTAKVSTTHDMVPIRLPRLYLVRRPLFALPYLVWTSAVMLRSDTILTVSRSSARDIRHFSGRRAIVIPPVFYPLATQGDPALVPPGLLHRNYIVYNGGLDPRKNVLNLLKGFAMVGREWPDLLLVMMGRGYSSLDSPIAELGISKSIVRTGYVDENTRSAIISLAAAMAYPSLYEGFGLPLLEAFATGTPVLTAANSSLAEVAGDAAVYVDPRDPSSIAEGIVRMRDPHLAADLRLKGLERLSHFDPMVSRERLVIELATAARGR